MRKQGEGLKIYFNPFAFTIEENNEFIRLGYEPIFLPLNDWARRA